MANKAIMQAIKPKNPELISSDKMRRAVIGVGIDTQREGLIEYRKTVKTWDNKPVFKADLPRIHGADIVFMFGTDNEIYAYVDFGTRPHLILPRRAPALAFQSGYTPKTARGVIGSTRGGSSGNRVFARAVYHPGTQARLFTKIIAAKAQAKIKPRMDKAIADVVRSENK